MSVNTADFIREKVKQFSRYLDVKKGTIRQDDDEIQSNQIVSLESDCACSINLSILLLEKVSCNNVILRNRAISKLKCSTRNKSCCFD